MMYPTDNDFGIPTLRSDRQGLAETPILAWGSVARGVRNEGTWHFYVDDYRFTARSLVQQIAATGCKSACEPNYTLTEQSPRYEALAVTARKRMVARALQELGIGVFVDLNVPERHIEDCLLGVPRGWRAFATRGSKDLERDHAYAAGGTLLVIGGGKPIEKLCQTLHGAIFVPSRKNG